MQPSTTATCRRTRAARSPYALPRQGLAAWCRGQPSESSACVPEALPERFRTAVNLGAGCGLRQGEIFGLPVDEIDFESGWLHIVNQVKVTTDGLVFGPPKRDKLRDVPVPDRVADALRLHMKEFPPVSITLPWLRKDGRPVTRKFTVHPP